MLLGSLTLRTPAASNRGTVVWRFALYNSLIAIFLLDACSVTGDVGEGLISSRLTVQLIVNLINDNGDCLRGLVGD